MYVFLFYVLNTLISYNVPIPPSLMIPPALSKIVFLHFILIYMNALSITCPSESRQYMNYLSSTSPSGDQLPLM